MFCYFQQEGGEDVWQECLASQREHTLAEQKPRYMTVLDVSELITETHTREQLAQLRYKGPLYFDWDATDNDTAIAKVQEFAENLEGYGVDLGSCAWYATGGRGFHCEIPAAIFMEKVPPKGLPYLYAIFKEMAFKLYTDCMDMRIYSGRKGRMWRCVNVQRENGAYKVQLTPRELKSLTVQSYKELCAAARPTFALEKPAFNAKLGIIYATAAQKVDTAAKKKNTQKRDAELLQKFRGKFPPTLERILRGEGIEPGTGFHPIAMQIAITANAIGIAEDKVLELAEGLCDSHQSDGTRYNTPKKRRDEIVRMMRYTDSNPCYAFAPGAIKSIAAKNVDTGDLDGVGEGAGKILAGGARAAEGGDETDFESGLSAHLQMRETGIYKKGEQGLQCISDIAFKEVRMMMSFPEAQQPSELWGYEADVLLMGQMKGRQSLPLGMFASRSKYNEFAMKVGGVMTGSDVDASIVSTMLRDSAVNSNNVVYVTRREGVDLIQDPTDSKRLDLVWVSPNETVWNREEACPYLFRSVAGNRGIFCSDLWNAPYLDGSEVDVIEALLYLHDTSVIGPMLGWMVSCFHRMIYDRLYSNFPLLQVYGQSQSGKTHTINLCLNMHHFRPADKLNLQIGADTSMFAVASRLSASCSIPQFIDEIKRKEMNQEKYNKVLRYLHGAYDNGVQEKGGGEDSTSTNYRQIASSTLSAPIVFAGEAAITGTAVQSRCVMVPVNNSGMKARKKYYDLVKERPEVLSAIGHSVLDGSLMLTDFAGFKENFSINERLVEEVLGPTAEPRAIFNNAVIYQGLDILGDILSEKFGSRFTQRIEELRHGVLIRHKEAGTANTMAEAAKVLDSIAYITRYEDVASDQYGLKEGRDYAFVNQGSRNCIDLKMQVVYTKYIRWCKANATRPLYDDEKAFLDGMGNFGACVNRACLDSKDLKDSPMTKVFRFDIDQLTKEGIQPFKRREE